MTAPTLGAAAEVLDLAAVRATVAMVTAARTPDGLRAALGLGPKATTEHATTEGAETP